MKNNELKRNNIRNVLIGTFFASFSFALISIFLPFFLKEKGLSALEIGGLFTLSIAAGSLFFGLFFSRILRKIKLKLGLISYGIFNFFRTFVLYLFPNLGGVVANQFTSEISKHVYRISTDSTIQHNIKKGEERKTGTLWNLIDCLGLIFGIVFCIFLIPLIGFRYSFLLFSLIAFISFFFYFRIDDKTRLKSLKKFKHLPKISKKLKLIFVADMFYYMALSASFSLVVTFLVSEKFSGGILQIGLLFIALYVSMSLTLFLTKEKLKKINELKTTILGMFILLSAALIVIFSENFYFIFGAFILEGIGAGIWVPSRTILQWKNTEKENKEKVSGWFSGLKGFVQTLGPLLGGFLITTFGVNSPFYLKAGTSILSLGIYFYILKKYKN
jgi:MFS family permease